MEMDGLRHLREMGVIERIDSISYDRGFDGPKTAIEVHKLGTVRLIRRRDGPSDVVVDGPTLIELSDQSTLVLYLGNRGKNAAGEERQTSIELPCVSAQRPASRSASVGMTQPIAAQPASSSRGIWYDPRPSRASENSDTPTGLGMLLTASTVRQLSLSWITSR